MKAVLYGRGETTNVAGENPETVGSLLQIVRRARHELGDARSVGNRARFFDDDPVRPDVEEATPFVDALELTL